MEAKIDFILNIIAIISTVVMIACIIRGHDMRVIIVCGGISAGHLVYQCIFKLGIFSFLDK